MSPYYRSFVLLHFIVFIWGFTGILGKLITLGALELVWWRTGFATLGILAWMLFRKKPLLPTRKQMKRYLGTGAIIAVHWVAFFQAIKVSNVSVTLACLSSASLFTALIEPLMYRRPVRMYEIWLGLLVIGGLLLIFNVEAGYRMGMVLAVVSVLFGATFTVINGRLVRHDGPTRISLYEMVGAFLVVSLFMGITDSFQPELFDISTADLAWVLVLGLLCTAFAYVASVEVMRHLEPFTVSLTINLEPVYTIALALLVFGESERMSAGFYAGAGVIVISLFLNAWFRKRQNRLNSAQV